MEEEKDWTGNIKSTWATLGASNHTDHDRAAHDYYATDPEALEIFLAKLAQDNITLSNNIWECAAGSGWLVEVLQKYGYNVRATDLYDYGIKNIETNVDFLGQTEEYEGDILTNPPYKDAQEFVEKAISLVKTGNKVIMFLKLTFLEGQKRKELFDNFPPKYVYVNSARQICYLNGNINKKMSSATCYAWFIWEKDYNGEPIIRWI